MAELMSEQQVIQLRELFQNISWIDINAFRFLLFMCVVLMDKIYVIL